MPPDTLAPTAPCASIADPAIAPDDAEPLSHDSAQAVRLAQAAGLFYDAEPEGGAIQSDAEAAIDERGIPLAAIARLIALAQAEALEAAIEAVRQERLSGDAPPNEGDEGYMGALADAERVIQELAGAARLAAKAPATGDAG